MQRSIDSSAARKTEAMAGAVEETAAAVFVPSIGRYVLSELWPLTLTTAGLAGLLYFRGALSWQWAATVGLSALLGIALGATFTRQARRLAIGDTWISGPLRGSREATTIPFSTLDAPNSELQRGRLVAQALGGQRIKVKLKWYSPADQEEIRRLARDRCGIMEQPS